jgi:hypothetical protein
VIKNNKAYIYLDLGLEHHIRIFSTWLSLKKYLNIGSGWCKKRMDMLVMWYQIENFAETRSELKKVFLLERIQYWRQQLMRFKLSWKARIFKMPYLVIKIAAFEIFEVSRFHFLWIFRLHNMTTDNIIDLKNNTYDTAAD